MVGGTCACRQSARGSPGSNHDDDNDVNRGYGNEEEGRGKGDVW